MINQFKRIRLMGGLLTAVMLSIVTACNSGGNDEATEMTDAHTRLVWVQDISASGSDTFANGTSLRLMGYDSKDGKGERPILDKTGNYAKPLFTADGKRVVFGNRQEESCYVVNFNGSKMTKLGTGYPCDVWTDPETDIEWVIVGVGKAGGKDSNTQYNQIDRIRLDKPEVREMIWNKSPVNMDNFQLSANGRHGAGLFPWPHAGRATLPNKGWDKSGQGCWTSLAPDNSLLMWVFDGAHRNLRMVPANGKGEWKINLTAAPGINGFEVYHPRWSNHARYMVMTGPYLGEGGQPGGNRIRSGGKKVEIYLGKFSDDFKVISEWVQITSNEHGDFFPDVWIKGGDKTSVADSMPDLQASTAPPPAPNTQPPAAAPPAQVKSDSNLKHTPGAWPENFDGLIFYWKNNKHDNKIRMKDGTDVATCQLVARSRAIFTRTYGADVHGGYLEPQQTASKFLKACRLSNAFTIEALIKPEDIQPSDTTHILSFSKDDNNRNMALVQTAGQLQLILRTSKTGKAGSVIPIGPLPDDGFVHVLATLAGERVSAWINGKRTCDKFVAAGTLDNWTEMPLVIGQQGDQRNDWRGEIDHIAVYGRGVSSREAERHAQLAMKDASSRTSPPILVVEAVMKQGQPTVTADQIGQYTRALNPAHYEVTNVKEGKLDERDIIVYHWTILDRTTYPYPAKPGETVTLRLQKKSDHPQLDAERVVHTFDDVDFLDMTEYIDLGTRGRTPAD